MRLLAKFIPVAFLFLSLLVTGCSTGKLDLHTIRNWDIVVAEDAIPAERYAAEEFRRIFALAIRVGIPIRTTPGEASGHIYIGPGAGASAGLPPFDAKVMGDEDLGIAIADSHIWITGGRPRGTLYGVYTFLEEHLGVRFLTADHTHVPPLKQGTLVDKSRRTYHPPLEFRWSYYRDNERDLSFGTRLRNNTITDDSRMGARTPMQLINHSFAKYVPWKKYGAAHPEYYNETFGKRPANVVDEQFNPGIQLCLTNPDVLRIVTEGVLRELDAKPSLRNISVSQNDNLSYCRCSRCREIDEREGSPMGSLLMFVNSVADEVAKKHPDVLVGTLAYQYSRKPPRTVRPRPNVQIQLCSIECCMNHSLEEDHCPLNEPFRSDMDGWSRISNKVYVWYYITNFANYLLPCPNLRIIEPDVRYFVRGGVRGLMMQGVYNGVGAEFSDLRNYVTSRLLWNPSLSGVKLTDEFLDLHYAESAGPIREFIAYTHDKALASGKHERCSRAGNRYGLDRSVAEVGIRKFDQALALAKSDEVQKRVELASICAHAMMVDALLDTDSQMTIYWRIRRNRPLLSATAPTTTPAHDGTSQVTEETAKLLAAARPHLRRMFELSERHGITMYSEWLTFEQARQAYRKLYGLADSDPF